MKDEILKKLKNSEIEILDEIVRVCEKNSINYFLCGGTLLGAIRHKGFIPWDDDIDIWMLRNDYEKFLKIAPSLLKSKFEIKHYLYDNQKYLPFMKVVNKNTEFLPYNARNFDDKCGIWVDIFPLDYIKKVNLIVKIKYKLIGILSKIIAYKTLKLKKQNRIFNLFISMTKIIPNAFLFKIIFLLQGHNLKKSDKLIDYFVLLPEVNKALYEYNDIFPLKKAKFENKEYNIPNNYDKVLKTQYGDYMTLPPLDKRITHKPLKIKFENGETFTFAPEND